MVLLRKYRLLLGSVVAVLLLAAGGMPGALAALSGPQPSFPVCTPDGATLPGHDGDTRADCELCPHGSCPAAAVLPAGPAVTAAFGSVSDDISGISAGEAPFRAELAPLSGRGPPSFAI
jgi:hypothetical protein